MPKLSWGRFAFFAVIIWGQSVHAQNCGQNCLWTELKSEGDLTEFVRLAERHSIVKAYLSGNANVTVFAPINSVFTDYPNSFWRSNDHRLLGLFADKKLTSLPYTISNSNVIKLRTLSDDFIYLTPVLNAGNQKEYYANNGRLCGPNVSHVQINGTYQTLYKICTYAGEEFFSGTAERFIFTPADLFASKPYDNKKLGILRMILRNQPSISRILFNQRSLRDFGTYFLPTNDALNRVKDAQLITTKVLQSHVMERDVCFTDTCSGRWLDSPKFIPNRFPSTVAGTTKLSIQTVAGQRYAVSLDERGHKVWAKIILGNIPVNNGVVHIIDSVLAIIDQDREHKLSTTDAGKRFLTLLKIAKIKLPEITTIFVPEHISHLNNGQLARVLRSHIIPGPPLGVQELLRIPSWATMEHGFFISVKKNKDGSAFVCNNLHHKCKKIIMDSIGTTNGVLHYLGAFAETPSFYQPKTETKTRKPKPQSKQHRKHHRIRHTKIVLPHKRQPQRYHTSYRAVKSSENERPALFLRRKVPKPVRKSAEHIRLPTIVKNTRRSRGRGFAESSIGHDNFYCSQPMDRGEYCVPFKHTTHFYYYNSSDRTCDRFAFKGCGGNRNKFSSRLTCFKECTNYKPLQRRPTRSAPSPQKKKESGCTKRFSSSSYMDAYCRISQKRRYFHYKRACQEFWRRDCDPDFHFKLSNACKSDC